jgi:amino acid transporter
LRSRQTGSRDLLEETMTEDRESGRAPAVSAGTEGPDGSLRGGALGLPAAVMQGVSHIAPAVGMVLTLQFITSLAGVTAPLAYALAFVIVLTLGISLTQLAKHLPSAGGYYTYVSRTVHPRAGFLTAWLFFLYDPTGAAINLAFMGFFFEGTMRTEYGINFPWWLFFVIGGAFISVLVYRGIEISARTMIVLASLEIALVVALGLTGLLSPGEGGINFASYNPAEAKDLSGLYLGVVFSIFAFTGFESVAPLAEETDNPRRNLPRAIILSILIMGAFYIFTSWALLVGWGTSDLNAFVNASENPVFLLAHRLWGVAWIVVFIAVINSILAVSIATTNAATRVFFAMGRSGALPGWLARVHPEHRTPSNAILLQTFITFAFGLGLGVALGPDQEFFLMGVAITLGLIFVYSMGNVGVFRYYRSERPGEFNVLLHVVFPLLSTIALLWVGYKSIVPLPDLPVGYAPFVVGVWLVIGIILVWWLSRTGREEWLRKAGEVMGEESVTEGPRGA